MRKLLVAVDGSPTSLDAVRYAVGLAKAGTEIEIHLLNVQPPLPAAASTFLSRDVVRSFHHEEGEKALAEARELVAKAGVRHETHVAVGAAAEAIVEYARERGCEQIVMGTRGLSPVPSLLLGSTATKVLHLTEVPVTLVPHRRRP